MKNENKVRVCIFFIAIAVFASFCYLWKNPEGLIKIGQKEEVIGKYKNSN